MHCENCADHKKVEKKLSPNKKGKWVQRSGEQRSKSKQKSGLRNMMWWCTTSNKMRNCMTQLNDTRKNQMARVCNVMVNSYMLELYSVQYAFTLLRRIILTVFDLLDFWSGNLNNLHTLYNWSMTTSQNGMIVRTFHNTCFLTLNLGDKIVGRCCIPQSTQIAEHNWFASQPLSPKSKHRNMV